MRYYLLIVVLSSYVICLVWKFLYDSNGFKISSYFLFYKVQHFWFYIEIFVPFVVDLYFRMMSMGLFALFYIQQSNKDFSFLLIFYIIHPYYFYPFIYPSHFFPSSPSIWIHSRSVSHQKTNNFSEIIINLLLFNLIYFIL